MWRAIPGLALVGVLTIGGLTAEAQGPGYYPGGRPGGWSSGAGNFVGGTGGNINAASSFQRGPNAAPANFNQGAAIGGCIAPPKNCWIPRNCGNGWHQNCGHSSQRPPTCGSGGHQNFDYYNGNVGGYGGSGNWGGVLGGQSNIGHGGNWGGNSSYPSCNPYHYPGCRHGR